MIQDLIGRVVSIDHCDGVDPSQDVLFYDYIIRFVDERYCIFRMATEYKSFLRTEILINNMYCGMIGVQERPYEEILFNRYYEHTKTKYVVDESAISYIKSAYALFQLIEIVEK